MASGAHDTEDRLPRPSAARELVQKQYEAEVVQALFVDKPRAVIESQPLVYFPEPVEPKRPAVLVLLSDRFSCTFVFKFQCRDRDSPQRAKTVRFWQEGRNHSLLAQPIGMRIR